MIARNENLSLTIPPDLLEFVRKRAIELGYADPSDYVCALLEAEALKAEVDLTDVHATPIWEKVQEIGASVPDSEWAKVPTDLSKNLKQYLYDPPREDE